MISLLEKISEKIKKDPSLYQPYEDMYYICLDEIKCDEAHAVMWLKWESEQLMKTIPTMRNDLTTMARMFDLHKKVLLKAAPFDFDSYMLYIEWNREPDKKFYVPRRKQLLPVVDALQGLVDDKYDLVAISMPPGAGKLVADDTPIMTRNGIKPHGDLVIGDEVIGLDGAFKKVQHVFPKNVANYEVEFTNGEVIKCHGNHEWYVYNRHRQKYENLTVLDMLKGGVIVGTEGKRGSRFQYQLPFTEPMAGTEQDLALDPYALGVWLGDGTSDVPRLTIADTDFCIVDKFVGRTGCEVIATRKQVGCTVFEFGGSLRKMLHSCGMCFDRKNHIEKHLPQEYLLGSVEQRLELLAGMLDTDGTLDASRGRYLYSTTNENIANGLMPLVSTFGWRYCHMTQEPKLSSSGIQGRKVVHIISFCPDIDIPCAVPRKRLTKTAMRRKIAIRAIRPIDPVPGNCIQVEGGIYRVGRTMLPTHNSTLAIFYLCWLAGREPNKPMLGGSHSNSFLRGVYDECLRVIGGNGGEYLWQDVFQGVRISNTNAKDMRIDLGLPKRFETLEFSSIGSGNAGKVRAESLLYCDDLVDGIETAMSKDRLDKLWQQYTTDLRQRKIGACKELHIATRWSLHDVIGRLADAYEGSERAKFIVMPALDENDESNFDYPCDAGFTTEFYHQQREIMDDASWRALYMNQPIEREGVLYAPDELRRYFELPDEEPDAVLAVCDTKDKGSDYCVLPIIYKYGNDWYLEDIVCDNGKPEIVDARLVEKLCKHKVHQARFESNSAGGKVAEKVRNALKAKGGTTKITTKFTTANKETRIVTRSDTVTKRVLFKDDSVITHDREYRKFLEQLCNYTMSGKNKHDDVPDAMAQLVDFMESFAGPQVSVFKRPW